MRHRILLKITFAAFALLLYFLGLFSQSSGVERFTVVSFNVENLFDTIPDSLYNDKEYLPSSQKKWNSKRYYRKLQQITEAISQAGGIEWPWIVALQEVENERTLQNLVIQKGFAGACYRPIISQGADARGMRVALLYAEGLFQPLRVSEWYIPTPPGFAPKPSRPLLAVSGKLLGKYPLTIFVLHFPSNRSGRKGSAPYRREAFRLIRSKCDSIKAADFSMPIMVLGDFNATPHTTVEVGWIIPYYGTSLPELGKMYDISVDRSEESLPGSYYFRNVYTQIDRILLSSHFLINSENTHITYIKGSFTNCLLMGKMRRQASGMNTPLRTFAGDNYIGGTSDHLPVRATFAIVQK